MVSGRSHPPSAGVRGDTVRPPGQLCAVPLELLVEASLLGFQGRDLVRDRVGVLLQQVDPVGQGLLVLAQLP